MATTNDGSGGSNYTGTSIHCLKENTDSHTLVGNDPKTEKAKLRDKLTQEDVIVGDYSCKARLLERIAGGSFGEVYLGEIMEKQTKVAVKMEPQNTWIQPTVMAEGNIYRKLGSNVDRIPRLHWFGFHGSGNSFAVMIMDLLGDSLYNLWVSCGQEFTMKTMLMVVEETISCLESIHEKNCIHRDVSPNNFAVCQNNGTRDRISVFDFGNAQILPAVKQVMFGSKGVRFGQPSISKVAGTPRFASIFGHLGQPPSYRDDLESLGYVWIYLIKGRLPWQGIRGASNEERLILIGKRKVETPIEALCDRLPIEFTHYLNYVRSLAYLQKPNYAEIKSMFRNLASSKNINYDWVFDWSR